MSSEGLLGSEAALAQAGLSFPYIPPHLAEAIEVRSPWAWASRPTSISPYNLQAYVDEVVSSGAGLPPDYVLFEHAGHGVNSWALHYYAVVGRLALFAQLRWGGAYMDDTELSRTKESLALASALVELADSLPAPKEPMGPGLVVVASDFTGGKLGWGTSDWPPDLSFGVVDVLRHAMTNLREAATEKEPEPDRPIPSYRLRLDDLPSAAEGWSESAVRFAHTIDGYAHVGAEEPDALWRTLVEPAMDNLDREGRLPSGYSIDDLRACIFYVARSDHFSWGGPDPRELHLYFAALDSIRRKLLRRRETEREAALKSRPVPPRASTPDRLIETDADVLILGCVSGKRLGPLPAKDLYDSDLFDRRRRYAEATGKPWVIFSAKHGILDPDDEIEWYDVALKELPRRIRRAKGEEAVRQLEKRFGPLAGMIFETHAGEAYRTAIEGPLSDRGARLLNPVEGLRIGELKQWYGRQLGSPETGPSAPPPARSDLVQGGITLGAIAVSEVTELSGFSWRWPEGTEEFDHGWDFAVSADGDRYRVRHGIGGRVVYGQYRVHSVTWLDKSPMVEGVAPDDYGTSGALVSIIRIGGGPHVRSLSELPLGYAGFEINRQSDEIKAKYARASLSVKILEDDLEGWARHAILRARSKGSPKPLAGSQQRPAPPVAPLSAPPDLDQQAITRVLLDYGRAAVAHQASQGPVEFTPNPEANRLVLEDPFAFLLAVILDQGIVAERAWAAPYELRRRLGHLDPARIVADPTAVAEAVSQTSDAPPVREHRSRLDRRGGPQGAEGVRGRRRAHLGRRARRRRARTTPRRFPGHRPKEGGNGRRDSREGHGGRDPVPQRNEHRVRRACSPGVPANGTVCA